MKQSPDNVEMGKNLTHYDTDDLEAYIKAAGRAAAELVFQSRDGKVRRSGRMAFTYPAYRRVQEVNVKYQPIAQSGPPEMANTTLALPHPKSDHLTAMDKIQYALGVMPTAQLRELWHFLFIRWFGNQGRIWIDGESRLAEVPPMPQHLTISVHEKVVDADKRKPLTKEERIRRAQEFYGDGGNTLGARRGCRADWRDRMSAARHYYEKELERTDKWAKKLREDGVEPEPYPTFADYLRQCADEIDGGV